MVRFQAHRVYGSALMHVGPIKKGWWTIVSLGAICGLIFNMHSITVNYMSFPTNINIKVEHRTELSFPSVTICNMSPVKRSSWAHKYGSVTAPAVAVSGSKRRRKRAGKHTHTHTHIPSSTHVVRPILHQYRLLISKSTYVLSERFREKRS